MSPGALFVCTHPADPEPTDTKAVFDAALRDLDERISLLAATVKS
jgi:hypothetical protein